MVPNNYLGYFQAAAQAAGGLIGLLFVVVALKPGRILGPSADAIAKGLAGSSFTGLVNAFFVSLLAIIPGKNLGTGAAIMAVVSLYHTVLRRPGRLDVRPTVMFVLSLLAYGAQLYFAIDFIRHPHDRDIVGDLAFILIASFGVALSRAWQLMQSSVVAAPPQSNG